VVKMAAKLIIAPKRNSVLSYAFCGQKVCQEHKFISACVLSMGIKFSLVELSVSGLKCLKMAARV